MNASPSCSRTPMRLCCSPNQPCSIAFQSMMQRSSSSTPNGHLSHGSPQPLQPLTSTRKIPPTSSTPQDLLEHQKVSQLLMQVSQILPRSKSISLRLLLRCAYSNLHPLPLMPQSGKLCLL